MRHILKILKEPSRFPGIRVTPLPGTGPRGGRQWELTTETESWQFEQLPHAPANMVDPVSALNSSGLHVGHWLNDSKQLITNHTIATELRHRMAELDRELRNRYFPRRSTR